MPVALTQFPRSGTIVVTQGYGGDTSHNINPWSVDFSASSGTDVLAVRSGTVVGICTGSFVGDTAAGGYGNYVTILHTGGFYATYAHLTSDSVSIGQTVSAGTKIGSSGATGSTQGAHIHVHFGTGSSGGAINAEGTDNIFRAFGGNDAVPPAFFASFFGPDEVGTYVDVNNPATILSTDIFGTGNWGGSAATDSDDLRGNAQDNRIFGGNGPDRLFGEDGNDLLVGGTSKDSYDGGSGVDTLSISYSGASWTVDFVQGTATAEGITETFVNIENFTGGSADDVITTMPTGNQNNTIDGGPGSDKVVLTYAFGQGYTPSGTVNNLVLQGSLGTDTFQNVELFQFAGNVTKTAAEVLSVSPDDYRSDTSTTGLVTLNAQFPGNIETPGDRDWARFQVTQGMTYTINLVNGSPPQIAPFLVDPELYLYNSSSQLISSNDDFGGTLNSQLTFEAAYTGNYFIGAGEHGDKAMGTYRVLASLACFALKTLIATPAGEKFVETLQVGDHVTTADGRLVPIKWVGYRRIDCRTHPHPYQVQPVRVCRNAFGPGLPKRDLYLSPDHAVFIRGVLIPVRYLVNRESIESVPTDSVVYYHVELHEHDVILAEGLPCESYLDICDRTNFSNGDGAMRLFPDFSPPSTNIAALWEARGYAPLVVYGPELEAARALINARMPINAAISATA